jgi:catechol 2,3-dioxygenase-like lactoylglutathione lyase family enzyme
MIRVATLVLVVRNLERALAVYEALGFERVGDAADVPSVGARQAVLRGTNCDLELLEPRDETKPPGLFLRARGEGVFSVALRVGDPAATRRKLAEAFVQARGGDRWYVPPADAHGVLIEVGPPEAEEQR